MNERIKGFVALGLLALAMVFGPGAERALADKIYLNDGRVLEGRVDREGEGFVYFVIVVGSIEHTELFTAAQIKKIERDEPAGDPGKVQASTIVPGAASKSSARSVPDGATRIVFISLEDEVGLYLNADALKHSVELAEPEKPDIVVLVVNSGGGALAEVEPLSDIIHKELKKKYRVVAWIRSAISAAAMTSLNSEEIYMTRQGNIGAAVAFTQDSGGQTKAAEGKNLEEILKIGEELARRGKRNPLIVRAMQKFMLLSCDIDENGVITWYDSDKGQFLVNPNDRILTFNAIDAEKFGVSKGMAETKEELAKLMGVSEWVEVGLKADEYQAEFRKNVKTIQARLNELGPRLDRAMAAAGQGSDAATRNQSIGKARQILGELRSLVRRAPSVEKYMGFNRQWFADREEELRKLAARNTGGGN